MQLLPADTGESYTLNNECIYKALEEVANFLESLNVPKKDALRVRFSLEESLLRFQDHFGADHPFVLRYGKTFGKLKIVVRVKGDMFDPLANYGEDPRATVFMRQALSNLGTVPVWRYSMNTNSLTFGLPKTNWPEWAHLVIAVVLAVVLGVSSQFLPADVVHAFSDGILSPLLDAFMGFLGAMAGPMIALAIVWGIYSIGDVATFSVLGKRLIGRYLIFTALITIVVGVVATPFFDLTGAAGAQTQLGFLEGFASVFQIVLGIVPSSLFTPFVEGNVLQIIFVATIFGMAMLLVGEKTRTVALFMEQVNILVQIIMEFIGKLVPGFVFGSLFYIIVSGQLAQIASCYKLLVVNVVAIAVLLAFYILMVKVRMGVHVGVLLRKALPTFIIGISTASSSAAYATNRATCSEQYGISDKLADFGVPFGQVIYKPTVALLYLTSALCAAEMYGVAMPSAWVIVAIAMSIVLSVATPPIPGGQLASYTVLFAQLGIPSEALAVVLAVGIVLDFLETPTDLVGGQTMLILAARKFKMIDADTLRK